MPLLYHSHYARVCVKSLPGSAANSMHTNMAARIDETKDNYAINSLSLLVSLNTKCLLLFIVTLAKDVSLWAI